ncbi:MAG: DEAD/DEAH box helicase [Planctomycetota bacterium]
MGFDDLKLIDPILEAIKAVGYLTPTPIQEQSIPLILEGKDILGCARTGTGKTAAFALPILQTLSETLPHTKNAVRALILSPTRELAAQIGDCFNDYGRFLDVRHTVIFGGVNQNPQAAALRRGIDVLIATPGRLLDLMQQNLVKLNGVEILVLDEADRMLDMGFIPDVRRIISKLSAQRQTLFFSATLSHNIQRIAADFVHDPVHVEASPTATTGEEVEQRVCFVEKDDKRDLLTHFLKDPSYERVLVFTRTKHGADRVARHLHRDGINAQAIHGNKSQNARTRAMDHFRSGETRALVATDVAARGIDIDDITHVFNFDMPSEPEVYVHRIGRTARAGAVGIAITFCDREERSMLARIEKLIQKTLTVIEDHPYHSAGTANRHAALATAAPAASRGRRGRPRGQFRHAGL